MKPGDTAMFALALALCALGTRSLAERDALAHNSQVPDQPPALQARLSHSTGSGASVDLRMLMEPGVPTYHD